MNNVEFIGRVTKDIELETSSNGNSRANFSLAVSREMQDKDGNKITDFFNFVAFGKKAEVVSKYLKKGDKVYIGGELWNNSYTDKNGEKKSFTNICVNKIEFLEKKESFEEQQKKELTPIDDKDLPF